jgi:hypothetical protein
LPSLIINIAGEPDFESGASAISVALETGCSDA